ncbi:MAG: hypothetical protein U9R06_00605 [Patescibacteria group bacterium]|nr:hypothetical protein [Patescibacteria group bacterium]
MPGRKIKFENENFYHIFNRGVLKSPLKAKGLLKGLRREAW